MLKTHLSGNPFKASSNTSGVLSVPCGNFLAMSSTYFSSGIRSSSESTWIRTEINHFIDKQWIRSFIPFYYCVISLFHSHHYQTGLIQLHFFTLILKLERTVTLWQQWSARYLHKCLNIVRSLSIHLELIVVSNDFFFQKINNLKEITWHGRFNVKVQKWSEFKSLKRNLFLNR